MTNSPQSFDHLILNAISSSQVIDLVRRMNLLPQLLRRKQEEDLVSLVPIDDEYLNAKRIEFIGTKSLDQILRENCWSSRDLDIHLSRPEAMRLFCEQRFGPGLEELFLSAGGGHDQVIYSLLRVRDPGLAQELWIRLEEGEETFSELAVSDGEGPEASRKGILGPLAMGNIAPPQLVDLLRTLQTGQISHPTVLGDWVVLVRLEQLTPARFDSKMRSFLLEQQLGSFLESRVQQILQGEAVEELHFFSLK
jgi:parvulin-like peptidyl-prolyl isomerase